MLKIRLQCRLVNDTGQHTPTSACCMLAAGSRSRACCDAHTGAALAVYKSINIRTYFSSKIVYEVLLTRYFSWPFPEI
jgi:hypothetical protein